MSRYVRAPIVMVTVKRRPSRFRWKGVWRNIVRIVDFWREVGAWWDGELEKDVFLVLDADGGFYEIFHERDTGGWLLNRVMD